MPFEVIRHKGNDEDASSRTNKIILIGTTVRSAMPALEEEKLSFPTLPLPDARRGDVIADDGTVTAQMVVAVDDTERIRAEARSHAARVQVHVNANWLMDGTGAPRPLTGTETGRRWSNVWHWMMSPLVVVEAILNSDDEAWTAERADEMLAAYRALVPDDPERIDFWYRNHTDATYMLYRTVLADGRVRAWVKHLPGLNLPLPTFGSDVASSTGWDGTGGTLNVTLPAFVTSSTEALVTE